MQKQLNFMMETIKGKTHFSVEALIQKTDLPFFVAIMACPLPKKFIIPQMEAFDGNQDPFDDLETYKTLMLLYNYYDRIMCKAFLATRKGLARKWFGNLLPSSINSFSELSQLFANHFIEGRHYRNPTTYLLNVKQ